MNKHFLLVVVASISINLCVSAPAQEQPSPGAEQSPREQMQLMRAQIVQNMIQRGIDPQEFFQQIRQKVEDGTFDLGELQKEMVDKGIMDQQMVQRMQSGFQSNALNAIKQRLGVTDEEWKVIRPKLEKVMLAASDVGQPGQISGPSMLLGGTVSSSPASKAMRELRDAVKNPRTPSDELTLKLRRWREAHEKAKADLAKTQKDLVEVLSVRQEAILMNMGVLQ